MEQKSAMVGITEIITNYLPVSRRKAIKFVKLYMEPKVIGNRLYVERKKLEELLSDPDREQFPLKF